MENFLTDEECALIISLAKESGLSASTTIRTNRKRISKEKIMALFIRNDINDDGILTNYEVFQKSSFIIDTFIMICRISNAPMLNTCPNIKCCSLLKMRSTNSSAKFRFIGTLR